MTQEATQITTTPPLPGLQLVQDTNKALETIATDFAGNDDPAAIAWPYATWAHPAEGTLKRRNASNSTWVVEGRLFRSHLPMYPVSETPALDIGPIYIIGEGVAEWSGTGYVATANIPFVGTTPEMDVGPIIYSLDRRQILLWQTIGTFEGYASAEVGDFRWGTSITPKPGTELLIGQTVDRTLPKYSALIAWAEVNGHMKASASWEKGAFHFSDMGANLIRLPDLRDQFIRATGTDADTANARTLGSWQLDMLKSHGHQSVSGVISGSGGTGSGSLRGGGALQETTFFGGVETRPVNVAFNPLIAL